MNTVKTILEDIAHRIGEPTMTAPFHEETLRRTLNRVYRQLNEEFHLVERQFPIKYADFAGGNSVVLPSDWIMPFKFTNADDDGIIEMSYLESNQFQTLIDGGLLAFNIGRADTHGLERTQTGRGNSLFLSAVDVDLDMIAWYYSLGTLLVSKEDADLIAGEDNTPQWPPQFVDGLYYGSCVELKADYPFYDLDLARFMQIRARMRTWTHRRQKGITPSMLGQELNERFMYTTDGL